ncbi:MAG: hypothetical protein IJU25_04160, partial [Lachnospiraceae bacterium]|nr:hypothetical protein [Lachnospiraceae bacterium]
LVDEGNFLYKGLYSAFYVMESAVGDVDYSMFSDALSSGSPWRIYTIFLHLLMPVTAYAVILVYFLKAVEWFRFTLLRGKKKVILFSALTEKSKAYAARIRDKDTLLVFANTDDGEKENFEEDRFRNMIFTDQNEIQTLKQLKLRDLTIMEMGDDESRNLQQSVGIIHYLSSQDRITAEDNISLYTVSHQPEAAVILDNLMNDARSKSPIGFRHTVIDEFKRIAFKLLYDSPLYELVDENTQTLNIMIIGFGRMGQEVLKAISWAGVFPDTDVNVHCISLQAVEHGRRLLSTCPELGVDLRHEGGFRVFKNGIQLNPDAPIYYYSTETDTPDFDEIIKNLSFCDYVVISLGEDAATISRALHVYRLIMREKYLNGAEIREPKILVRIRDNDNLQMLSTKEDRSVFSHFTVFGSDEDIYSAKQVGQSELDHLAENVCNIYRDENGQTDEMSKYAYRPETEKNSNQSAAMHALYKLHFCHGVSFEKLDASVSKEEAARIHEESVKAYKANVSEEERHKLAEWEHIRWQAYLRTEGYVYCPYERTKAIYDRCYHGDRGAAIKETRAALQNARIHPCIGDVRPHLENISRLLGRIPDDPDNYYRNDLRFVNSIPETLRGYYRITAKQ